MPTNQRVFVFIVFVVACFGLANSSMAAPVIPQFFAFEHAKADMTWQYTSDDESEWIEGIFQVYLPEKGYVFISTNLDQADQRVVGYKGITAVHSGGGGVHYEYSLSQLFRIYDELFLPLIYLLDVSGEWLGQTTLLERPVWLYQTDTNPPLVYWFDAEFGLPLRIEVADGDDYLSVSNYTLCQDDETLEALVYRITYGYWQGFITLARDQVGSWNPIEIQVIDDFAQIHITYDNWQVLDTRADFTTLDNLATSLEAGIHAYRTKEYVEVISAFRNVLRIDPYYLQGYIYLAFTYGMLDNYLGAVENYQQWLMLEPHNAVALNNLAFTHFQANARLGEAVALAKRAIAIERQPAYLDTLGYGYYLRKEYDLALDYLLEAKEGLQGAVLAEVYGHLILVYQALGQVENVVYYQEKKALLIDGELSI